jgi:hypothetical protein
VPVQIPDGHPPPKDPPSALKQPTFPKDPAPHQIASHAQLPKDLPSAPGPEGLPGSIPEDVLRDSQLPSVLHSRAKELRDGPVSTPDLPEPKQARKEPAKPQEVEPQRARKEPPKPQEAEAKRARKDPTVRTEADAKRARKEPAAPTEAERLQGPVHSQPPTDAPSQPPGRRREGNAPAERGEGAPARIAGAARDPVRSLHHPGTLVLWLRPCGSPLRCA